MARALQARAVDFPMLATIERYRRISPSQRLRLTFQMQKSAERYQLSGTPEQVRRKFELIRRENDSRNFNMLTAIARSREHYEQSGRMMNVE